MSGLAVDNGRDGVQWARHIPRHQNPQLPQDEAVPLARHVEHPLVQVGCVLPSSLAHLVVLYERFTVECCLLVVFFVKDVRIICYVQFTNVHSEFGFG